MNLDLDDSGFICLKPALATDSNSNNFSSLPSFEFLVES